ncbi:MAG: hypothetical protein LBK75_09545 [Oscillospiraceae bacterium]|jgi:hypothetical protein|nr:hypothetical protein [Oscillospiraceae bacterium]
MIENLLAAIRLAECAGRANEFFPNFNYITIFGSDYAECTTIRMNPSLSDEALSIISYGHIGSLFFNCDLLGYGFMGLSTFFIAFTMAPKSKSDKVLRGLLWDHEVFFLPCLIVPMFPVFTVGMSTVLGTISLEIWCAYFIPICILGYRYFRREQNRPANHRPAREKKRH